ncbi:MAG: hypothetical protein JW837_13315 [Sedimentisphaerales bacterium]|nr:hypothetical protein [Sedimentisphaerales bacterium]
MFCWRKLISVICGVLLFTAVAHADMVPIFEPDIELQTSACDLSQTKEKQMDMSCLNDSPLAFDFNLIIVRFPHDDVSNIEQLDQAPHLINLTGEPGSVSLCLYTLMGLGMCSTPHWFKRLSFVNVHEYYHNGGPFQIGHSYAVSPKTLCPVQAYCFIQPACRAVEDSFKLYRLRAIVSPRRKSQFTPDITASRGPPLASPVKAVLSF